MMETKASKSQYEVKYRIKRNNNTMLSFRIFLIVASFGVVVAAKEVSENFQCMAAYAKTKGIKDPTFENVDYNISKEPCVKLRHKFYSDVRQEVRSIVSKTGFLPKNQSCIFEKLIGNESYMKSIIKEAALSYFESDEPSGKLNSIVEMVVDYIHTATTTCNRENEFGKEFDELFELERNATKNVTDFEKEYCVKKYLIKNNLIDAISYNIEPNPHNINVTGLNCEDAIRKANEDIYEQLGLAGSNLGNAERVECAMEKFREADYFDLMMKIRTLTTIEITLAQRSSEREDFVRILSRISFNIATC